MSNVLELNWPRIRSSLTQVFVLLVVYLLVPLAEVVRVKVWNAWSFTSMLLYAVIM